MRGARLVRHGLAALAALLLALPCQAEELPEVLQRVLMQHPDIRSSQALLDAAGERIIQARSNYYPVFGLESLAADASDRQFGQPLERTTRRSEAYLRWNLFRGMTDAQTVGMARHDRGAAFADLAEAHEQVALQVSRAYLEVLRYRGLLALGDEYIAEHQRLNEDIQIRAEHGRVAVSDLEYVKGSLIQAELQHSQRRGELRGAEQFYRLLTGAEPKGLGEPVFASRQGELALEQLWDEVLNGNRRVRAAQERATARAKEVAIAAGGLYPSLDLELRRTLQSEIDPVPVTQTQHSTQLQLRYQVPLGGGSYSRKREAVDRKLAAQATVDSELLQLQGEVTRLWASWQESRAIEPRLEERVTTSDVIVSAYDLQFTAGRRTLAELISVRSDRYRAQADLLNNRMDQYLANAQLLTLLGQLRETLLAAAAPGQNPLQ